MPITKKRVPRFKKKKKWSAGVSKQSNALDLEQGIFEGDDAKKITASLKRSAKRSHRRKGSALQSAMSMLNFYINRGGTNLSQSKKKVLEEVKVELKKLFKEVNKEQTDK